MYPCMSLFWLSLSKGFSSHSKQCMPYPAIPSYQALFFFIPLSMIDALYTYLFLPVMK